MRGGVKCAGGLLLRRRASTEKPLERFGLINFEKILEKITFFYPVGELYQSKVNMCF